jgi:hypothetical protein
MPLERLQVGLDCKAHETVSIKTEFDQKLALRSLPGAEETLSPTLLHKLAAYERRKVP